MKAKELISRLQSLDPNLDVYISNTEETQLSKIDVVIPCENFREKDRGEFIGIFLASDPHPLFTLTAEEVERVEDSLNYSLRDLYRHLAVCEEVGDPRAKAYEEEIAIHENLLNRIKQWQYENNN